jgi:single-stranded DNA-binding protein
MFTYAEFQLQGYVGNITTQGKCLKINIAASERWTDRNTGEAREKTRWNTVTFWETAPGYNWIKANLKTGDLVQARGDIEATSYEKDGETVYVTDLRADRIAIIPTGKGR